MLIAKSAGTDNVASSLTARTGTSEGMRAGGVFHVQCLDKDGNLKWETSEHNLVVNEGLQDMNTQYFKGAAYTAAWYIGLVTGPGAGVSYTATDTLASKSWTEFTDYAGARKTLTFGTASTADPSVISNSSPASFTITGGGGTVAGAFVCSVSSGTGGVLFSESNFQSPGDRVVVSGDVLNVTYSFSLAAV